MHTVLIYDLGLAKDAVALVDAKLDHMIVTEDADADGTLDTLNNLYGSGFTALQTFVTAVVSNSNLDKRKALELGPIHTCGVSFAGLVNAAANHWKHSSEWSKTAPSRQALQTIGIFESLGVDPWGDYALANALHAIVNPHQTRFASLLPFLERWSQLSLAV